MQPMNKKGATLNIRIRNQGENKSSSSNNSGKLMATEVVILASKQAKLEGEALKISNQADDLLKSLGAR